MTKYFIITAAFALLALLSYQSHSQIAVNLKPGTEGKYSVVFSIAPDSSPSGTSDRFNIYTWTYSGALAIKRGYIDLNIPTIPQNATVDSAKLFLFFNPTESTESFYTHYGNNNLQIERVIENWEPGSISWNNQPATSDDNIVMIPQKDSINQDYQIDVTPLVQDMISSPEESFGFLIRNQDERDYYRGSLFASGYHANEALHPQLTIYLSFDNAHCETYDTIVVNTFETIYDTITSTVYDTLTAYFTIYDTVTFQQTVYDTLVIQQTIYDTTYVSVDDTLIIYLPTTSIPSITAQMRVFPNPTVEYITIDADNMEDFSNYTISITDISGTEVYNSIITDSSLSVDIASLGDPGLYFINIINEDGIVLTTKKIVLQ